MEKEQRNSSIELLRILSILLIIFAHFNVHGIWLVTKDYFSYGWQTFFSCMTGWGGNVGNEIFMLITGYFMITGKMHWKRIVLLVTTLFFYSWVIVGIWEGMGWTLTIKDILRHMIPLLSGTNWFVCCYLMFMCFVPFINPFLKKLSKKQYQTLAVLNYFLFNLIPILGFDGITYMKGPFIQFFIMYMLGGYIRLYGISWNICRQKIFWQKCFFIGILFIMCVSVLPVIQSRFWDFYMKGIRLVELPMALTCFMLALQHKPFFSRRINSIAASVLGVYLIHDNQLVRPFIWTIWYPNLEYMNTLYFPLFMICKVLFIFLICVSIDQLRLHLVEPYVQKYIDAHWGKWEKWLESLKSKIGEAAN